MNSLYNTLWELGSISGCHRSFFWKGKQFPVCARCTGAFIGYFMGIVSYPFYQMPGMISVLFCGILFVDWFIQYLNWIQSNNIRRVISGILCGYGLIQLYLKLLVWIMFSISGN